MTNLEREIKEAPIAIQSPEKLLTWEVDYIQTASLLTAALARIKELEEEIKELEKEIEDLQHPTRAERMANCY